MATKFVMLSGGIDSTAALILSLSGGRLNTRNIL